LTTHTTTKRRPWSHSRMKNNKVQYKGSADVGYVAMYVGNSVCEAKKKKKHTCLTTGAQSSPVECLQLPETSDACQTHRLAGFCDMQKCNRTQTKKIQEDFLTEVPGLRMLMICQVNCLVCVLKFCFKSNHQRTKSFRIETNCGVRRTWYWKFYLC
jgi:hypothetical protein